MDSTPRLQDFGVGYDKQLRLTRATLVHYRPGCVVRALPRRREHPPSLFTSVADAIERVVLE